MPEPTEVDNGTPVAQPAQTDNGTPTQPIPPQVQPQEPQLILGKFKDQAALEKSYTELEKMVGKNKVTLPGEDATPEQMNEFYAKLGRPEKPEGYEFDKVEGLEENEYAEIDMMKQWLHEAGVGQREAKVLYQKYMDSKIQTKKIWKENFEKAYVEGHNKLQQEWGLKYQENLDLAKKAFETFGDDSVSDFYKQHGNNPALVKVFAKVGEAISDDKLSGTGFSSISMTPQQAQSEIDSIMGDRSGPYYDKQHPEHSATVKKVTELFNQIP